MRLDRPTSSHPHAEDPRAALLTDRGPGLWGPLYFFLWLHSALLALLVFLPRHGDEGVIEAGFWVLVLGAAAGLATLTRDSLHDLIAGMNEREKFALGMLVLAVFVTPGMFKGYRVLPDGFLWATPLQIVMAVRPSSTRRLLAWTMLGGWVAAFWAREVEHVVLALALGASWLLALGATHFAFTGDEHGLAGWWPVRKVIWNAVTVSLPALVVGVALWLIWDEWNPQGVGRLMALLGVAFKSWKVGRTVNQQQAGELLWWGVSTLCITLLLIVLMFYIRRYFLRRRKTVLESDVLPGQVARMEFHREALRRAKPHLEGTRGQIVELWSRWASALARAGVGRKESETAAQYAGRLAAGEVDLSPSPEMTGLLERAHYGDEEPSAQDVRAMRALVERELEHLARAEQEAFDPLARAENTTRKP